MKDYRIHKGKNKISIIPKEEIIPCHGCGDTFMTDDLRFKYCPECREKRRIASARIKGFYRRKNTEQNRMISLIFGEHFSTCPCCFMIFNPYAENSQLKPRIICRACYENKKLKGNYYYYKRLKKEWTIDTYKKYIKWQKNGGFKSKVDFRYKDDKKKYTTLYTKEHRKKYLTRPIKHVMPTKRKRYESPYLKQMFEKYNDGICHRCENDVGQLWIEFVNFGSDFLFNETLKIWQPYCQKCLKFLRKGGDK